MQPGGLSCAGPTDLFILHTRCTRLAFNPVANEGRRSREGEWYVRVTARKVERGHLNPVPTDISPVFTVFLGEPTAKADESGQLLELNFVPSWGMMVYHG